MRKLKCLRCGEDMQFVRREDFQLGRTGWILGDWPNLLAGAMELDVYACKGCGKVELFLPEGESEGGDAGEMPQKKCPKCGATIDFDYPKCPVCKYDFWGREGERARVVSLF